MIEPDNKYKQSSEKGVNFSKHKQVACIDKFSNIHNGDDYNLSYNIQPPVNARNDPDSHQYFTSSYEAGERPCMVITTDSGNY